MSGSIEERLFGNELFSVALTAAAVHSRSFKPIAMGSLQQIAMEAAAEVFQPSGFGARSAAEGALSLDERKDHARAAMGLLVDAMAAQAGTIPGYEADMLGERTLGGALHALCPCWPIC